jgi:dihydrofolate reductase
MGKPIIMGRRTHESIGRPLPGRPNIVVSRHPDFQAPGCEVAGCLDEALSAASQARECMVIGGAGLYRHALPIAERIYLTRVHANVEGDVFFPDLSWDEWKLLESTDRPADEANPYDLSFMSFQRE